jgi:hypothetical protein
LDLTCTLSLPINLPDDSSCSSTSQTELQSVACVVSSEEPLGILGALIALSERETIVSTAQTL